MDDGDRPCVIVTSHFFGISIGSYRIIQFPPWFLHSCLVVVIFKPRRVLESTEGEIPHLPHFFDVRDR